MIRVKWVTYFVYYKSSILCLPFSVFLLFLSCKSNNQVKNNTFLKQEVTTNKIISKHKKQGPNKFSGKYVKKIKNNMLRKFKIWQQKLLSKLYDCHQKYNGLKNTPCKPEKIVEVKKENIYVLRTINFEKYKKILERKLTTVKNLRLRREIVEKLFFISLAEKNWTKAYDLYQMFLAKTEQKFYDLLLAYIYFNNAEENEAKNILKKYRNNEEKKIEIKLVKFCKKIISYGIFEPKPNILKKGTTALVYILVGNVDSIHTNNDFKINLSVRISISRKKEKFVLLDEESFVLNFKHKVYDVLLPVRLQIPLNLSYNYYYMKIDITDLNNNKSDSKTLKVKVIK